jgi:hypothetical protein
MMSTKGTSRFIVIYFVVIIVLYFLMILLYFVILLHYFVLFILYFVIFLRFYYISDGCMTAIHSYNELFFHVLFFTRVPRLLSVRTRETLQPQISRLQKSFQVCDAENNGKGIPNQQNNRKLQGYEKMDNTRDPEYRNFNTVGTLNPAIEAEDFLDDDDDLYLAELGNSEFDESDARNKARVVKLLAQMKSETTELVNLKLQPSLHMNANDNANSQNIPLANPSKAVGNILKMQFNPPGGPLSHTGNPSDFTALTATLHNHDKMSERNENHVRVKSLSKTKEKEMLKEKEKEEEKERGINDYGDNNGDEINVTRIIVGNLDAFIDRYPYFMEKVNGWVKVSKSDLLVSLFCVTRSSLII